MTNRKQEIADKLQTQSKLVNKTQKEIAKHLQVGQSYVSDVFNAKKLLSGDLFEKLLDYLEFHEDEKNLLNLLFVQTKADLASTSKLIKFLSEYLPGGIRDIEFMLKLGDSEYERYLDEYEKYIRNYVISSSFFVTSDTPYTYIFNKLITCYNQIRNVYKLFPPNLKNEPKIKNMLELAQTSNALVIKRESECV